MQGSAPGARRFRIARCAPTACWSPNPTVCGSATPRRRQTRWRVECRTPDGRSQARSAASTRSRRCRPACSSWSTRATTTGSSTSRTASPRCASRSASTRARRQRARHAPGGVEPRCSAPGSRCAAADACGPAEARIVPGATRLLQRCAASTRRAARCPARPTLSWSSRAAAARRERWAAAASRPPTLRAEGEGTLRGHRQQRRAAHDGRRAGGDLGRPLRHHRAPRRHRGPTSRRMTPRPARASRVRHGGGRGVEASRGALMLAAGRPAAARARLRGHAQRRVARSLSGAAPASRASRERASSARARRAASAPAGRRHAAGRPVQLRRGRAADLPDLPAGYPPGTKRCPKDGRVPDPLCGVHAPRSSRRPVRTCPSCGAQLASGAAFCGACGQAPAWVTRLPAYTGTRGPFSLSVTQSWGCVERLRA